MQAQGHKTIRVTVVEEWVDETGDYVTNTLFEAASRSGEQLARFVPAEVAASLGAPGAAVTIYPERRDEVEPDAEYDERGAGEQGDPVPAEVESIPDARPKRKRRTKAEIEADRAREAAAQSGQGPTGNGDADLAAAAGAVEQQQVDVTTATDSGKVVEAGPQGVADAAVIAASPVPAGTPAGTGNEQQAAPAAPWNPFAQ